MDSSFRVIGVHGSGVFSSVLKAIEISTNNEVAIKIARNRPTLLVILNPLT